MLEQALLTLQFAVPALAFLYRPQYFPRLRPLALFTLCCVVVYGLFIAHAQLVNLRLERELYAFDLDGDRAFSGIEITPEQTLAMYAWSHDTSFSMAPIAGLIVSPLIVGFGFAIVIAVRRTSAYLRHRFGRNS